MKQIKKEKNLKVAMIDLYLKENIYMEKEMEKEKNIMRMVN